MLCTPSCVPHVAQPMRYTPVVRKQNVKRCVRCNVRGAFYWVRSGLCNICCAVYVVQLVCSTIRGVVHVHAHT
eukprot:7575521-Pyramimonas_sp.AAC.1